MVATTVRLTPRARSPSARPTAAGSPQPIPPLAVAKKEAGRVVGIQRSCWAIVEVDSVTNGESAGFTEARVDHTASGTSGGDADRVDRGGTDRRGGHLAVAVVIDHAHEVLQRQQRVAEHAVTDRCRRGQGRIVGDLQQIGALGQILAGHIGVVAEDLCPDDDRQVMTAQGLFGTGDGHRQRPLIEPVVLGKGRPVRQRSGVDRCAEFLREGHGGVPRAAAINLGTVDQHGPLRTVDALGEAAQPLGIGADPMADRSHHGRAQRRLVPVVKRDGQEDRARRRLNGDRVGPHERRRNVLGAGGLDRPI